MQIPLWECVLNTLPPFIEFVPQSQETNGKNMMVSGLHPRRQPLLCVPQLRTGAWEAGRTCWFETILSSTNQPSCQRKTPSLTLS